MDSSIQQLFGDLAEGDEDAATRLVDEYFGKLVHVARRKLQAMPLQVADDEGAVVSAFRSFFSGMRRRQFDTLEDRYDLWRLLATITARKAIRQVRQHWRAKGEGGKVERLIDVARVLEQKPTPEQVAMLIDQCETRIKRLDDETLERIALLKLEGHETREIAEQLGVHQRTIQRKLALIQARWLEEPEDLEDES